MGQAILFLPHKRAKVCPKMPKLPQFCKQPLKRTGFIINHLALAWLVIPWPLHLTFFCLLIIFLTKLTSLVCYAIFFFQIICFVACITIKICIYSVKQNFLTKKNFQICDDFTGYKEDTIWFSLQAFAWFSDLLVEHSEIFWSLFGVDMDTVLSEQPPDT